eukprot:6076318-Amphidinium_carterae.1
MSFLPGTACMSPLVVCITCVLCFCTGAGLNSFWNSLFCGCGIRFTQNCITLNCCGKPESTSAVYCVMSPSEKHDGTSAVYCGTLSSEHYAVGAGKAVNRPTMFDAEYFANATIA